MRELPLGYEYLGRDSNVRKKYLVTCWELQIEWMADDCFRGCLQHLTDLLAASEQEVVIGALQALVAFLRKTHHSSVRFHGYPKLNSRLFDLCRGWGGKEEV